MSNHTINNINGINPNKWGMHLWKSMHYISLNYPENPSKKDKLFYKNFYTSLKDVIPCSVCKKHYAKTLLEIPLDKYSLENKLNLFKWTVKIHNKVNERKNKPLLSYDQALVVYSNTANKITNILYIILILVILKILIIYN